MNLLDKFLECKKNLMESNLSGAIDENQMAFEAALDAMGYKIEPVYPDGRKHVLTPEQFIAFDNAINDYDGDGPRPKASSYGVETSAFAAQHGITL